MAMGQVLTEPRARVVAAFIGLVSAVVGAVGGYVAATEIARNNSREQNHEYEEKIRERDRKISLLEAKNEDLARKLSGSVSPPDPDPQSVTPFGPFKNVPTDQTLTRVKIRTSQFELSGEHCEIHDTTYLCALWMQVEGTRQLYSSYSWFSSHVAVDEHGGPHKLIDNYFLTTDGKRKEKDARLGEGQGIWLVQEFDQATPTKRLAIHSSYPVSQSIENIPVK